ncbi:MAG: TRAP transporter small permease subunit, partial [Oscillospiraceae bacterium]|nr:TRAP transporter small permease subunit [Oscillospiraceae bacterium]
MTKLFEILDKIEPVYEWTEKILMFICKILLIADICITAYSVCGRLLHDYIPFLKDPSWTEEMVLTLMSYMAVLSAALAIRHKAHIRMDVFDPMLPKKVVKISNVICDIGVLILGIIMLVEGWTYAST